ncbi:putative pre-mRNA-splicing factor ATP-dependent RNA helicase prp43 [Smittium mucronatum]|nr:putative pre-mRNA-splicing factor ATP-dependent RNA helicase prp43 [Smittium mucronatum]
MQNGEYSNNPYLAHLSEQNNKFYSNSHNNSLKYQPGKSTEESQLEIENASTNFFTGNPYTKQYKDILKKRIQLPVFKKRAEFLNLIHNNQILILVGETGSGKTTQ